MHLHPIYVPEQHQNPNSTKIQTQKIVPEVLSRGSPAAEYSRRLTSSSGTVLAGCLEAYYAQRDV
jgi:hypothetical protein